MNNKFQKTRIMSNRPSFVLPWKDSSWGCFSLSGEMRDASNVTFKYLLMLSKRGWRKIYQRASSFAVLFVVACIFNIQVLVTSITKAFERHERKNKSRDFYAERFGIRLRKLRNARKGHCIVILKGTKMKAFMAFFHSQRRPKYSLSLNIFNLYPSVLIVWRPALCESTDTLAPRFINQILNNIPMNAFESVL